EILPPSLTQCSPIWEGHFLTILSAQSRESLFGTPNRGRSQVPRGRIPSSDSAMLGNVGRIVHQERPPPPWTCVPRVGASSVPARTRSLDRYFPRVPTPRGAPQHDAVST